MRIFIPPGPLGRARELDLQKWVGGKHWPVDKYFTMVDRCRQSLALINDELEDSPDAIVFQLAAILRVDTEYQTYILDIRKANLGDDDEWFNKCLAAAWAIIQRYSREVDKGEWKSDLSSAPTDVA
jgi:hypothetical protein